MRRAFAPSCERNQESILKVLKEIITKDNKKLLEVGSGTGQHAVYFAPLFPELLWYTSDRACNHLTINSYISDKKHKNIKPPVSFEVGKDPFPKKPFDLFFTANTFHIMSWKQVKTLIKSMGGNLRQGSKVMIYGPFNYNGQYTSESNKEFDKALKQNDPKSGIRSFEDINKNMLDQGFDLIKDYEMPTNNRMLTYIRSRR